MMNDKAYVFLANGFEEIEAITPVDIFRRADIDVLTVSINSTKLVIGSRGIPITADRLFTETDFSDASMLILPGGLPGTTNLNDFKALKDLLLNADTESKFIAAICAAPLILGQLKLLKDKNATCYPGFEDHLIEANYTASPIEISGHIITSNGVGSAMKFALQLVTILKGIDTANDLAKKMLIQ